MKNIRSLLFTLTCITLTSTPLQAMEPQTTSELLPSTADQTQAIVQVVEMISYVSQYPKKFSKLFYFIEELYEKYGKNCIEIVQNGLTQTGMLLTGLKDPCGRTVLSIACSQGNVDLVNVILAIAGDKAEQLIFDVKANGNTAFSTAVLLGDDGCAAILLARIGDQAWSLIIKQNNEGDTAFHYATKLRFKKMIRTFLEKAPDRNAITNLMKLSNCNGYTPWKLSNPNGEFITGEINEINRIFLEYVDKGEMPYQPINMEHYNRLNLEKYDK